MEKAVQLYHKGGDIAHALELCFNTAAGGQAGMFEQLRAITEDLGKEQGSASPQVPPHTSWHITAAMSKLVLSLSHIWR